ncbi:UNVERIFIED_CONTAM: hypothetical protein GTU68_006402 [Idotea baltica]|nr:hypothetical protein [Idotea baltica]
MLKLLMTHQIKLFAELLVLKVKRQESKEQKKLVRLSEKWERRIKFLKFLSTEMVSITTGK